MLTPTYYPEHETAAIAGLVKSDACGAAEVAKILAESAFFDPFNVVAYRVVRRRRDAGVSVDPRSLTTDLSLALSEMPFCRPDEAPEKAKQIVIDLFAHRGGTGKTADLRYHAEKVVDAARIRMTYAKIDEMVKTAEAFTHSDEADAFGGKQLQAQIQSLAMSLTEGEMNTEGQTLTAIVDDKFAQMEADYQNPVRRLIGLSTGFPSLNLRFKGLCPGALYVIAAKRGEGKTSFSLDMVRNSARFNKASWQIFSREMTAEEVAERMLYQEAQIDAEKYNARTLSATDWANLRLAKDRLRGVGERIDVYDGSGMTVERVAAICRQAKFAGRCDGILVDYIQILDTEDKKRSSNRTQELDAIAKSLKDIAMELKVPLVTPCQLNKDGIARESEGIENTANAMIRLRPQEGQSADEEVLNYTAEIPKNRGGSKKPVDLTFRPGMTRFDERTYEAPDGTRF